MRLYRVYPHRAGARRGEYGHALYRTMLQGSGRIDNPERYFVLYVSTNPITAVAETFAYQPSPWDATTLFRADGLPYHLATLELPNTAKRCDLDDPQALLERQLKPSIVISKHRTKTQAWALTIFEEQRWHGVTWWSFYDPDNAVAGLWNLDAVDLIASETLTIQHAVFNGAAELLNRSISG